LEAPKLLGSDLYIAAGFAYGCKNPTAPSDGGRVNVGDIQFVQ